MTMDPVQEFNNFLQRLKYQGFLDSQFDIVLEIQTTTGNQRYFLEMLSMFYNSVDGCLEELRLNLQSRFAPDYHDMKVITHRITGASASMGGCKLESACRNLLRAIETMNKERCLAELENVKVEYINLHANLDILAHMQRRINGDF